jgi:hypothetical protein
VLLGQGTEARGNVVRQQAQAKAARAHAQRTRALAGIGLDDMLQDETQAAGALSALPDLGPFRRQGIERAAEGRQRAGERGTVGLHGGIQVEPVDPSLVSAQRRLHRAHRLLQRTAELLHRRRTHAACGQLAPRVLQQQLDLARARMLAEGFRGKIGQLVRLIEDEGIDGRQQFAEALLLQRQVGKQQVVIDDDNVGIERSTTRREQAGATRTAVCAELSCVGSSACAMVCIAELATWQIATARRARPCRDRAPAGGRPRSAAAGRERRCRGDDRSDRLSSDLH